QARQAFRNLENAMQAAGGTLKDIVALRIYVVDYQAESGTAVGTVLREFSSQENPPASTWIGASALAVPEFLIEIEATAVLDWVFAQETPVSRRLILFAPGAGAPSSHPWMQNWKRRLSEIGEVETFDYDYMRAGHKWPD